MLKVLHTSDWHLGRTLYGQRRYEEHEAFLSWLLERMAALEVEILLVAGDVFDTIAPSTRAQTMYYRFLHRAGAAGCRHVVITGGNHDSASLLDAPKALLDALDIHVLGGMPASVEEEVLLLRDAQGVPEAVVCAVPFLRESDLRKVDAGESVEDKARKLTDGLAAHYREVAEVACRRKAVAEQELPEGTSVPILGMGHLFTAGGEVAEDDGVRELYVGSLAQLSATAFPNCFDYLALGHLHVPQRVNGSETMRYSGSPLPMGFGEARQQKQVLLVTFGPQTISVQPEPVPVFQPLAHVEGDLGTITSAIGTWRATAPNVWLEVVYNGEDVFDSLREKLDALVTGTEMKILRIRNERVAARALAASLEEESLEELADGEVFARCLDTHEIPPAQRQELEQAYREIVTALHETDGGEPACVS